MSEITFTYRDFITIIINGYKIIGKDEYSIGKIDIDLEVLLDFKKKGFLNFRELEKDYTLEDINFRKIYIYAQTKDGNVNKDGILNKNLIKSITNHLIKNYSFNDINKLLLKAGVKSFLLYDNVINENIILAILSFYNKSKFKNDNKILFSLISSTLLVSNDTNIILGLDKQLKNKGFYIKNKQINYLERVITNNIYSAKDYIGSNIDSLFIYFLCKLLFIPEKKKLSKFQEESMSSLFKRDENVINTFGGDGGIRHLSLNDKYGKDYESDLLYLHSKLYHLYEKALGCKLLDNLYIEIEDCSDEALLKNNDSPLCVKKYKVKKGDFELLRDATSEDFKYNLFNFIYQKNIDNIKCYVNEYFKKWENNELDSMKNNYLLINKQVEQVEKDLLELKNKYGIKNIKFNFIAKEKELGNEVDYLGTLLYFNNIGKIQIKNYYDFSGDLIFDINDIKSNDNCECNDLVLKLNIDNIILYDNKNYPITNSEYKILNKFISSKNNEINIMDTSITTNLESLNKMKLRLQNKLDNKIKINKVRNKNLWYLSK